MNKHIDSETRYQIQIGIAKGLAVSAIAQGIGYSVSTVYREIARNGGGVSGEILVASDITFTRAYPGAHAPMQADRGALGFWRVVV